MEYKKFNDKYVVRIDKDEEIIEQLNLLCNKENINVGEITGLGASKYVKVGLFDTEKKEYNSKEYFGPMEITSLIGNISRKEGNVYLHLHINLCDSSMNVFGGHLNECVVGATCELMVTKIDGDVDREFNEDIGLNLYKF